MANKITWEDVLKIAIEENQEYTPVHFKFEPVMMRTGARTITFNYDELKDLIEPPHYEFPLPGLETTDGEQQYLTCKKGKFFASRKVADLRQAWKKEHFKHLPKEYIQYATKVVD